MKSMRKIIFSIFAVLMLLMIWAVEPSYAGGPLFSGTNGKPIRWSKSEIKGGPLNSTTVDSQGRIVYRVDQGPLGPLSNEEAVRLVDRIFKLYTDIPTSSIEFVNGGSIKDPRNGQPIDINGSNVGLVMGRTLTFQNSIIFDSDSSIVGGGGVLGLAGPIGRTQDNGVSTPDLVESIAVLNGAAINVFGKIPFLGVFTHEFGHFAGPLDHSQVYGFILDPDFGNREADANIPTGFTLGQLFDVYLPFIETVYPFFYRSPSSSKLAANGFNTTGPFIASLSFDDVVAFSTLYPVPGYLPTDSGSQFGGISGKVIIQTQDGGEAISGLNVVARRISRGSYPPKPDLQVYPDSKPPVDADGIPLPPEDRDDLDPLATATSLVTGLDTGVGVAQGEFKFVGLPPGDYMVSVERLNSEALGGSSIGPRSNSGGLQAGLFVIENYNGANESNDPAVDNPKDFTPVKVSAGSMTSGINIILNGIGGTVRDIAEKEPNEKFKKANLIGTDVRLTGNVTSTDKAKTLIDLGSIGTDGLEDIYRVDLQEPTSLLILLEGDSKTSDLDLYLLKTVPKRLSLSDPNLLEVSFALGSSELITKQLPAGTYYIGVTALEGSSKYKLDVFKQR
jgi:hypothetical protein